MEYKAYLKQSAEGCDYTIGCAQTFINVPGDNVDQALENLKNIILEEYNTDERALETATLFCISNTHEINVHELYFDFETKKSEKEEADAEAAELAEYNRLQKKYGNNSQN